MKSLDKESSNYESQRDRLNQALRQSSFPEVPMDAYREQVVESIRNNPSSIIIGETGSGKSTRIPSYLLDAFPSARIAITQPRRVAARSVASYVAGQRGGKIGDEIGYKVRFDNETTEGTRATFMTDGILLRDLQSDPLLHKYDIVVVDEAHERNLNTDLLLGLLKRAQLGRENKGMKGLKIVVTSATLEKEKFESYFSNSSTVEVPGRMHPVKIEYVKDWREEDDCFDERGRLNIFRLAAKRVKQAVQEGPGDILIFMPGQHEIETTIRKIEDLHFSGVDILPLHGGLAPEDQDRIFQKGHKRKIIVATNIAETSLTIDGVRFVIDSGLIKQKEYNPHSGIEGLKVSNHAQSGCKQRAGRAGRTAPGICYRLCTEDEFNQFHEPYQRPEILRSNLDHVILLMKSMGIQDVQSFDFIDPLNQSAVYKGIETLKMLGALDELENITELGRKMVDLPLRPEIARMVIEAEKYGCVERVCTIAAMMGEKSVFVRPKDKELEANKAHEIFTRDGSDFLTLLEVWNQWSYNGFSENWARKNFLNIRQLYECREIRAQLLEELHKKEVSIKGQQVDPETIQKCIAAGLMHYLMALDGDKNYRKLGTTGDYQDYYIHRSSVAFFKLPSLMIGANVVATHRNYARLCQPLKPELALELAPHMFKMGAGMAYYDTERKEVLERTPLMHIPSLRDALPSLFGRSEPYYRVVAYFIRTTNSEQATQLLVNLIMKGELKLPCHDHNWKTALDINDLYYRSGGQISEVNLGDWYDERLRGCTAYAQALALSDQLFLKLEDHCSLEQKDFIDRHYPQNVQIKGNFYPIQYSMYSGHKATVHLSSEIIFQLQEDDLPVLGTSEKPLYLMVQSNVIGSKPDTLGAVKRSLNEEKLEEVWITWLGKNEILLDELSAPLPTVQSLGKVPVAYGYDYQSKEVLAYPAIKSQRDYDPFNMRFTYQFYLSYFRNAEEALIAEAEAQKNIVERDSNKVAERDSQGLAEEIAARRHGLEIMIDRAELDLDQLKEFRSKEYEITTFFHQNSEDFKANGGLQHVREMIKRVERELENVINNRKRGDDNVQTRMNPLSGALKGLMDRLPDRPVPSSPVQPVLDSPNSDIVDDSEAESEDNDQEAAYETDELEAMTDNLRNELLIKLNAVQRILEEVSETPKAEMWKKNATQINKLKKQAADNLSKVKDLELTLAKSEQNDSFDQKVENALMEAKKLLDKMKEVGGVAASWSERYNSMLELDIPSIESAYGGKISAKNLSDLKKRLVEVAKNPKIADTKAFIEEVVAEKLLAQ